MGLLLRLEQAVAAGDRDAATKAGQKLLSGIQPDPQDLWGADVRALVQRRLSELR